MPYLKSLTLLQCSFHSKCLKLMGGPAYMPSPLMHPFCAHSSHASGLEYDESKGLFTIIT